MEHLAHLWRQYERACVENRNYQQHRPAMEVLIPFHDWVYVPGSKTNEIESAAIAHHWLTKVCEFKLDLVIQIPRIILGTQHHSNPRNELEALFFDMDLSGLGGPSEEYSRHASQVMEEFLTHVPINQYLVGRAEWLKSMLQRPFIFNLPEFLQFESQARENMLAELNQLESR
jgi:predicted metal-dependent HD superfamily phosphohydrolase